MRQGGRCEVWLQNRTLMLNEQLSRRGGREERRGIAATPRLSALRNGEGPHRPRCTGRGPAATLTLVHDRPAAHGKGCWPAPGAGLGPGLQDSGWRCCCSRTRTACQPLLPLAGPC